MIKNYDFDTAQLPLQADRYRLVLSAHCPFCRRAAIARRLLGLEDHIALSSFNARCSDGFEYVPADAETPFDPQLRVRTTRELYRRQSAWQLQDGTGVPVIVDDSAPADDNIRVRESAHILRQLTTVWARSQFGQALEFKPGCSYDLYPESHSEQIEKANEWLDQLLVPVVSKIIHGEDDLGTSRLLHNALGHLDELLSNSEFLTGSEPRECDVRAFASLGTLVSAQSYILNGFESLNAWFKRLWHLPGWVSEAERAVLDPKGLL